MKSEQYDFRHCLYINNKKSHLSQGSQHILEIIVIDEPVPVLVNHVEGLLELLDLVLVEHGEDVGGGALGTLLRARTSGRFAARHLGGPSGH